MQGFVFVGREVAEGAVAPERVEEVLEPFGHGARELEDRVSVIPRVIAELVFRGATDGHGATN
jgi:hypothetical protein